MGAADYASAPKLTLSTARIGEQGGLLHLPEYFYAQNSPAVYTDPSGECIPCLLLAIGAVLLATTSCTLETEECQKALLKKAAESVACPNLANSEHPGQVLPLGGTSKSNERSPECKKAQGEFAVEQEKCAISMKHGPIPSLKSPSGGVGL